MKDKQIDPKAHKSKQTEKYKCTMKEFQSNSSFAIKEVTGFIYGGFSSRFWMLRKHTNFLDRIIMNHLPFFAWQCISILMPGRTIDLVIPSGSQMKTLIKYLIWSLETVDGFRGTARPYLDTVNNIAINKVVRVTGGKISRTKMFEIQKMNAQNLYEKISKKYGIIIIRLKISYMAMQKGLTI